jgi:hypothetical protein
MAYPEPIPILKKKESREFEERLKNFSLTEEQVRKYARAKKKFS